MMGSTNKRMNCEVMLLSVLLASFHRGAHPLIPLSRSRKEIPTKLWRDRTIFLGRKPRTAVFSERPAGDLLEDFSSKFSNWIVDGLEVKVSGESPTGTVLRTAASKFPSVVQSPLNMMLDLMEEENKASTTSLPALQSQLKTLIRVSVPSLFFGLVACWLYPSVSLSIAQMQDDKVLDVIGNDYSQYVQNILTTSGLIFSLTTGYTYYFMYQQQEAIFLALFEEVSEAKSLLEQVAMVCEGRTNMYPKILQCIQRYVQEDLRASTKSSFNPIPPAQLLSSRPSDDPLESIMYLTSVGEPSVIYKTVKSLRYCRSKRLGALQQKLPDLHMYSLRLLAFLLLTTFPVCGAGSQVLGGFNLLKVQSVYFGVLVFGIVLVLNVVTELWKPRGGAYNVDSVLAVMVSGLEEELEVRLNGELGGDNIQSHALASPSSNQMDNVVSAEKNTKRRKKMRWKIWKRG